MRGVMASFLQIEDGPPHPPVRPFALWLAARVLVFSPWPLAAPAATLAAIQASGALWCAAFGLFAVKFWPILARARIDGRPG
jgi:uncharacterized protein involved in response to NO